MGGKEVDKSSALPQWILDYQLVEWGQQGLFYEYLEMGKFSFVHWVHSFEQLPILHEEPFLIIFMSKGKTLGSPHDDKTEF